MAKISVIIPVHNTEKYLAKCLESAVNQTYKDIEIICIDDASTDNSLAVIKEYAQKDNRIKYESFEENKGVSSARNRGIDIAEGEYIYFLDSDDWLSPNYLEIMLKTTEETKADIIMNRNMISFQNEKYFPFQFQQGQLKIPDNSFIDTIKDTHNISVGPCTKLFKRDFLKKYNIKFPDGYIYEDIFFHYATFAYANKVYFFKGSEYFYRKTEGSITSNMNSESGKVINVFSLVYDFYNERNLLNTGIKIYYTMPKYNIDDEQTYLNFKAYFEKAGEYILNSDIYNDLDKFFCKNILSSKNYTDYMEKHPANAAISYIRRGKCTATI